MNILYITMDGFDTASPNNQMAEQLIDGFYNWVTAFTLFRANGSTPMMCFRGRS